MDLKRIHLCLFGFISLIAIINLVGATGLPDFQLGCPIPYFGERCKTARPVRECESDSDCNKSKGPNFKCCVSWCHGTKCEEQKFRPGTCPRVDKYVKCSILTKSDNLCGVDSECPQGQLCCSTICGGTSCQNPAGPPDVKFGCPFPPRKQVFCPAFIPKPQCDNDADCPKGEHCCTNACGFVRCLAPKLKPGSCPKLRKILCKKADILRCGVDSDCSGNEKCCRTECGGSACKGKCVDAHGNSYFEGQTWKKNACETCTCTNGKIICASKLCQKPPCSNPIKIPGTCCDFICKDACTSDGNTYKNGDSWVSPQDKCKICHCNSGTVICIYRKCAGPPISTCRMDEKVCCKWICPNKCIVNGVTYEEGQSWTDPKDPCLHCTCKMGKPECFPTPCAAPPCKDYKVKPGTCCEWICPDTCEVDGEIYEDGDRWQPDPCQFCRCEKGEPRCASMACKPPPCVNYKIKPGTCCEYICPGCKVGDVTYTDGRSWKPNPCTFCRCDGGKPICAVQDCAAPPCKNYKIKPGTCCNYICEPDLPPGLLKLRKGCPIPSFGPQCALVRVGRFCRGDKDCTGYKEKCCVTNCGGTQCIGPDFKPGVCPKIDKGIRCVRQDDIRCGVDKDCGNGRSLCCITPCGGTMCKDPAGFPEVRIGCPLPSRPIEEIICLAIPPIINCKSDSDCKAPQICCHDGCDNIRCVDPARQKPGMCPKVPLAKCIQSDVITCGVDNECGGNKKCCRTPCAGSACQGPFNGCLVKGVKYNNGESWNPSPCEHCTCANGKPLCALQSCAPPPCQNYKIKPGTCCHFICEPDLPPGLPKLRQGCPIPTFGPKCDLIKPGRFCKSDSDCKSPKEKCCVTDCGGTRCFEPEFKPGVCLRVPPGIVCVRQDDVRCGVDSECEGRNLCCGTPCGGTMCKDPAGFPEARLGCPLPPRPVDEVICKAIPPVFQCKDDSQCKPNQICCHDACGSVLCLDQAVQKPGECPAVPLAKCKRADIVRCGVDSECEENEKCCRTACSGSSCEDAVKDMCKDNKKWKETIILGKKKCKNCKCKKLKKKKFKSLLLHACKHNIGGILKGCCASCKKVLSY